MHHLISFLALSENEKQYIAVFDESPPNFRCLNMKYLEKSH